MKPSDARPSPELANWRPPVELERSRPRETHLTASGHALAVSAIAIAVAGFVVAGILLHQIETQTRYEQSLAEDGVVSEARVEALTRSHGENPKHYVEYRFSVGGRTITGRGRVPKALWKSLRKGDSIELLYLPSQPEIRRFRDVRPRPTPVWVAIVAIGAGSALSLLLLMILRAQQRLVAEGRVAAGRVLRHETAADRSKGTTYHYAYRLLSGAERTGRAGPATKPPPVGSVIPILYDPDMPDTSTPYPPALVACPARRIAARG